MTSALSNDVPPLGDDMVNRDRDGSVREYYNAAARRRVDGAGKAAPFKNATTILATTYPPLRWAIEGFVPEGFSVLGGRQKLGKSRMALDFALAITTGGVALGKIGCQPGDVLYIDLENGEARVQRRMREALGLAGDLDVSRLYWLFEAGQLDDKFFATLDGWRGAVAHPTLIIIDVLQRIKPPAASRAQTSYERDYAVYAPLQSYAAKHRLAILGLHHTRKGGADDPLEALSGSNGLSAVADTTLLLDRTSEGTTLYVRGRDVPECDTALTSVDGLWHLQGDAAEVRRSAQRNAILDTLRESIEPMTPREVSDLTGATQTSVRKTLARMAKKGEVERIGRGQYQTPCHIGHNGHNQQDHQHVVTESASNEADEGDKVVTPRCDSGRLDGAPGHHNQVGDRTGVQDPPDVVTEPADVTPAERDTPACLVASFKEKGQDLRGSLSSSDADVTVVTDVTPPRKGDVS